MRITPVNDRALVRLIPETHHKPPVLRGLVDSDSEAAILAELEGETSWIILALAAVGIIAAIVLLTDGDDEPTSP